TPPIGARPRPGYRHGRAVVDVLVIDSADRLRDIIPGHRRRVGPLDRVVISRHGPGRDGPARRTGREPLAGVAAPHQLTVAAGPVDHFTKAGGRIRRRRPGAEREDAESGGGKGNSFHNTSSLTYSAGYRRADANETTAGNENSHPA